MAAYVPNAVAPGTPVSSYALNNLFSLNYFTGALNFNLPLVTVGGRGEAAMTVGVVQDSARAITDTFGPSNFCPTQGTSCHVYYVSGVSVTSAAVTFDRVYNQAGWMEVKYADNVIKGTTSNAYAVARIYFYRPGGTATELVDQINYGQPVLTQCNLYGNGYSSACSNMNDRGRVFVSHDGSQLKFQSDTDIVDAVYFGYPQNNAVTGTLYFPTGVKYHVQNGVVDTITDRNGNKSSIGRIP